LGRNPSTVTRWANGEGWPLIQTPGLVRFQHVPVAFLERRFGIKVTGAKIDRAARLHDAQRRAKAAARGFVSNPREDAPSSKASSGVHAQH